MSQVHRTTISLSKKNHDKLKELGFGGDSFNTIVGRLIEKVEEDILNVY
jgi:predicted CopG family antitoxin